MSDNNEKLQQFLMVTGIDEERARFYMESSAWDLEVALTSFYDADNEHELPPSAENPRVEPDEEPTEEHQAKSKPKAKSRANSKFATLNTLQSSSDEEEEGQAYYAGGSENSGQQVLGPPKQKKDIVADMFKSVQEHGVEILDSASSSSSAVFRGTGYRLGQTDNDSVQVPGAPAPSQPVQVTMKLWRDGFSLDEGSLRMYDDPSNRSFLESVRRGEIPQELRQGVNEVHLSMEDHRMMAFKEHATKGGKSTKPFTGKGHTLGSPAPPTVGTPLNEDRSVNEAHARQLVKVDPAQPTTNLQIRLADGSRLVGQFNNSHTVGEVRSFIVAARPQYQTREFDLMSTYPMKALEDGQTLEAAGILNSAIMQKLK